MLVMPGAMFGHHSQGTVIKGLGEARAAAKHSAMHTAVSLNFADLQCLKSPSYNCKRRILQSNLDQ